VFDKDDGNGTQAKVDIILIARNAYKNMKIPRMLTSCIKSVIFFSPKTKFHIHMITGKGSNLRIARTISIIEQETGHKVSYNFYDLAEIEESLKDTIHMLREMFFFKDVGRYNDNIFFITPSFHKIFYPRINKAIFLDLDVEFRDDIAHLYNEFEKFEPENVIGLGFDLQPHYRSQFKKYRENHPGTMVGEANPGKQGFNTGVMLMDFKKMNDSTLYNSMLNKEKINKLRVKYDFMEGFLGHQDFYTLLGMKYPELFYRLPCQWNRQLDTSWKPHYSEVIFEKYHKCEGRIRLYHANGNTVIPKRQPIMK